MSASHIPTILSSVETSTTAESGDVSIGFLLKDPGLVGNADDNMSCLHACAQMIMKTKQGAPVHSFDEIDKILRREKGQYSWWYGICADLVKHGFDVCSIGAFSTQRFVDEGEDYLFEFMGEHAARIEIANATISNVREDAREFLANKHAQTLSFALTLDDIRHYIRDGWYVVPSVNARVLNDRLGYNAHFVFIYGFDAQHVIFHDPGLPPIAARKVPWELFDKAWSWPSEKNRKIMCFRARQGIY